MKTEVLKITPEIAESLLSTAHDNRTINKHRVLSYSKAMEDGDWKQNGESIKIDRAGILIDGQHRLSAIIQCGLTIPMLVVRDLDHSVFDTIDTGKSRTGGDVLKIQGIQNSTNVSSGVTLYLLLSGRGIGYRVDNRMVLSEYLTNPTLYQNLSAIGGMFYKTNHRIITPAEYIGFYRFFCTRLDANTVDKFFDNIENRVGICGLLHGKLMENVISKRKMLKTERYAIIIKAFIYHVTGRDVKILKFAKDEPFPQLSELKLEHIQDEA